MRETKFRAWDKMQSYMVHFELDDLDGDLILENKAPRMVRLPNCEIMQYTGLKDKNTSTDIYECDIIDMEGNIRGNIYESPEVYKALSTCVVAGMGYEDWENTKQRLVRQGKLIAEQSDLPQILRELGQCS